VDAILDLVAQARRYPNSTAAYINLRRAMHPAGICELIIADSPCQTDLEIIMAYTGWNRETAETAIRTWKRYRPGWNAQYLVPYIQG
jgi:hypothetical protein